ncbi:MAG: type I-E CRISPR-associated endoribonuclease Cas2 [Deltaproteobacteria bacterium]|nr:type I-E CRISPR-associated endoribonuclease Cas2 [Deltaproteobacteria bacterium]
MVILILEKAPTTLKGELTRWLLELRPGVFVGQVSALVREALFERCRARIGQGGVLMLVPAQTEQGFRAITAGRLSRELVDAEGLYLVRVPHKIDPSVPF